MPIGEVARENTAIERSGSLIIDYKEETLFGPRILFTIRMAENKSRKTKFIEHYSNVAVSLVSFPFF